MRTAGDGIDLDLLLAITAAPTAPFREQSVVSLVLRICEDQAVPCYRDPDGNLVLGVASAAALTRAIRMQTRRPLLVFSAHMDHPGFHGLRWNPFAPGEGSELEVVWLGNAPRGAIEESPVWLADTEQGWSGRGRLVHARYRPPPESGLFGGIVSLDGDAPRTRIAPRRLYGGFRFHAPCWVTRRKLHGRSLDDLAGVYCLVDLARLFLPGPAARNQPPPFVGLLTRAEEAAFVGIVGHLKRTHYHRASRPVHLISVDATPSVRGARVGRGVVIRPGDRATAFDPATVASVSRIADAVLDRRIQRPAIGATTCEAGVAIAFGVPATGIAVALGNHHNEGPGDLCVAPEHLDIDDLADIGRLCRALVENSAPWEHPLSDRRSALVEAYNGYRDLLAQDTIPASQPPGREKKA